MHELNSLARELRASKNARRGLPRTLDAVGAASTPGGDEIPNLQGQTWPGDIADYGRAPPSTSGTDYAKGVTDSVGAAAAPGANCEILTSAAQPCYPGSKALTIGPGTFPLTALQAVNPSANRINVDVPGRYAYAIIDAYERGEHPKSVSFKPRVQWGIRHTYSGKSYYIDSPFIEYVDYCSWWKRAWDWIDSRCPMYAKVAGYGLGSTWAWEGVQGKRTRWNEKRVFGDKEFLLRAWGFVDRHRHLITPTQCCDGDYAKAIKTGEGFTIGPWQGETQHVTTPAEFEPVYPYGWTIGEQALASTTGRSISFFRKHVASMAQLASWWAHAAVTTYCFAFTWRSAIGEDAFEDLLAACQECVRMVESCALVIGVHCVHELVHALKPAESRPSHIRRACCHQTLSCRWAAKCLYEERLFPPMVARRFIHNTFSGLGVAWQSGMFVTELDVFSLKNAFGPLGVILDESRVDADNESLHAAWFNTTRRWDPFGDQQVRAGGGSLTINAAVAFSASECDDFTIHAVLRSDPWTTEAEDYRGPNFWMDGAPDHPEFGAAC